MTLKATDIVSLICVYGENATLGDIYKRVANGRIHRCPKCNGNGTITIEYNAYPKGLPDSGFVYEAGYRDEECDLCNGQGYTKEEYIPKMVQDGWEVKK